MAKKLKILILEDSATDAELIERLLGKSDIHFEYNVVTRKSEFVDALGSYRPDVILSDNSVAQFNALEALNTVKSKNVPAVFILVTGTVSEEFAVDIIKAGADDYILKDRLSRLPTAIHAALNQRRAEREKNEAFNRLLESEAKYRNLIERISDGFIALDLDLRITFVNKVAEKFLNRSAESIVGKYLRDEFPDALERPFFQAYEKAAVTGQSMHVEDYSSVLDRWVFVSVYPSGTGLAVLFRDITEQRKAEIEAKRQEEKFKIFIDRINDAFIALDKNYCYTYLNKEAGELINRNPEELIGKNVWEIFPDAIGTKTYQAITHAMETQEFVSNIDYYAPLDLWQENSVFPSADGLSIFIRDITKRMRDEERLKKSNELFQNAMLATSDVLWELDFITNEYQVYKGKEKPSPLDNLDNLVFDASNELVAEEDRAAVIKSFEDAKNDPAQQFWDCEYGIQTADGRNLFINNHALIVRDEKGTAIKAIGAIKDITDKKLLQEQLLEQQKREQLLITATTLDAQEKERNLIGSELHDNVNQILVGTKLLLSIIKGESKETHQTLNDCITNLQTAIDENRKLSHSLVSPNLYSDNLENQLKNLSFEMLNKTGIKTMVKIKPEAELLLTNEQKLMLYRIAQEQSTNILKYAKAKHVKILLSVEEEKFQFLIADDGVGTTPSKKTTGIGLQNMKARASIFDGTVITKTAPGKGFALEIEFPMRRGKTG